MPPRFQVVQRIEYDLELAEPFDAELGIFDVGMMGDDLDRPVELFGDFLRNLESEMSVGSVQLGTGRGPIPKLWVS